MRTFAPPAGTAVAATTSVASDGTVVLDGRRVFPLVLAKGPELDSTTPEGEDGLDELTTTGPNRVSCFGIEPGNGFVATETLDPLDLGFAPAQPEDLRGGDPDENARITRDLLTGEDRGPRRDVVLLNAAAALVAGGTAAGFEEGIAYAAESIDSGAALNALESLITYSQSVAV